MKSSVWKPSWVITASFGVLAVCATGVAVRLCGAWTSLPAIAGDQLAFLPVAHEIATTGDFVHPFLSPFGDERHAFNWHGWLYPLVVSWLPTTRSAETILFGATALAVLSILPFVIHARLARLDLKRAAIMVTIVTAVAMYQVGRPECLVTFFMGWGLVCSNIPALSKGLAPIVAILLACIGVTQPTVASAVLLAFVLYVCWTWESDWHAAWRLIVVPVVSAAIVVGLTEWLTPLSFRGWLAGLHEHATAIGSRTDGNLRYFIGFFVLSGPGSAAFPFSVIYLLILGLIGAKWWSALRARRVRVIGAVAAALLLVYIALMSMRIPATIYNFIALVPLIAAVAVQTLSTRLEQGLLWGATAAACVGLAWGILSVVTAADGVELRTMQAAIARANPCAVSPSRSAWLAVAEAIGPERTCGPEQNCPYAILLQINANSPRPPAELRSLPLTIDAFDPAPPTLFGIPTGRIRKDYAYAVYAEPSKCPPWVKPSEP